ncbi:hypothetical protein [Magnetospira sp. QH-2]|uniref:hypothetical protein n=1 Tax=Magnetospira sp. (strain QH-2) TaxID=1288970 RepID=UPI0003E81355|nr:hypothetical protein [Magnetospira sp. QH-2]CCQ74576.1 protein of unknown function [Magnetospira sp. QH-2]
MNERVTFQLDRPDGEDRGPSHCTLTINDSTLLGHEATFRILTKVTVKDSDPVNEEEVHFSTDLMLDQPAVRIDLPDEPLRTFSYDGPSISIRTLAWLKVDDGLIFDTKISQDLPVHPIDKEKPTGDPIRTIDPRDDFSMTANIGAISWPARLLFGLVVILALGMIGGIFWVLHHDLTVPLGQEIFFERGDSPMETLLFTLAGLFFIVRASWSLMKRILRRYILLTRPEPRSAIRLGDRIPVSRLVAGQSRIDLRNIELRVVAANLECGQVWRGRGKNRSLESFEKAGRAVTLYTKKVAHIPVGIPIADYFTGDVDFTPMFKALYPPLEIGSSHGLKVYWEIQLIHRDLVDQELRYDDLDYVYEDFLEA